MLTMKMETDEIERHIRTTELQVKIVEYLAKCEEDNKEVVSLLCNAILPNTGN